MKRLVDPNKLCMGCMAEISDNTKPCPKCGFLLSNYIQPSNSLPAMEILNGKYLVGKSIGMGGFGITYIGWDFYQSKRICIKEYFPQKLASRGATTDVGRNETSISKNNNYMGKSNSAVGNKAFTNSLSVFAYRTGAKKKAYADGLMAYIKEAENLSKFYFLPGIVSVRDFFLGNGTAYIVMEFIDGIDMKKMAGMNGGKLDNIFVFEVLKDVIKALGEVHKAGIIHRDISPDNIMITDNNKGKFEAKLIDFGAAKNHNGERDNAILLKHGYAPIEQYDRNGNQGPWTDVYSMCATIYYCLSGIKIQKSYDRIAEDNVVSLSSLGIQVTEAQDEAIMKGLSVQIEDRYQTMDEMYQTLYGGD
ncbi:MAG: serine/threonine protein kinase [Lachnospiraceae bacterium]|nr:serine/threonine protein kinase [Lachnospiraceae bacterium]